MKIIVYYRAQGSCGSSRDEGSCVVSIAQTTEVVSYLLMWETPVEMIAELARFFD